jgi:hypothetical protein
VIKERNRMILKGLKAWKRRLGKKERKAKSGERLKFLANSSLISCCLKVRTTYIVF